jgi:hypothetical protein
VWIGGHAVGSASKIRMITVQAIVVVSWRKIAVTLTDLGIGRFSMSEIERLRPSVIELRIAAFARSDVGKLFMLAKGGRNFAQY